MPQSPPQRSSSNRLTKTNPYRKSLPSDTSTEIKRSASTNSRPPNAYPSPPPSASPRSPHSPSYRQDAFSATSNNLPSGRRRRGSSLTEKYPGDMSHRPLDQLAREKAIADKSRHSTRKHHIRPDSIDTLDDAGISAYHHGGPYDATLFARNNSKNSPLQAVADSNAEALKATPKEKVIDSLQGHRPLDGVASYAPGQTDRMGHTYQYKQGENMMTADGAGGGAYRRWPGVQYHPDDIKGKGEPSYSLEKALKEHSLDEKSANGKYERYSDGYGGGENGIEMTSKSSSTTGRHRSGSHRSSGGAMGMVGDNVDGSGMGRKGSLKGLKERIGHITRHAHKGD